MLSRSRANAPSTIAARVSMTTPMGWRTDQLEMPEVTGVLRDTVW